MLNIPEEVKALFRADSVRKNLRIHFPNGEREDILNKNIISESFSFDESLCSQSELKFGLCETSCVQFTAVGIGNIKDCEIEVYHEIDISSQSAEFIAEYGMSSEDVPFPFYRIPYGVFVVDSCQRQADMTRRKVVAYNVYFKEMNPLYKTMIKSIPFTNSQSLGIVVEPFLLSNIKNAKDISKMLNEIYSDNDEEQSSYAKYAIKTFDDYAYCVFDDIVGIATGVTSINVKVFGIETSTTEENGILLHDKIYSKAIVNINEKIKKIKRDFKEKLKIAFSGTAYADNVIELETDENFKTLENKGAFDYLHNRVKSTDNYVNLLTRNGYIYDDNFYYMAGNSTNLFKTVGFSGVFLPIFAQITIKGWKSGISSIYAINTYDVNLKNTEIPSNWQELDGTDVKGVFRYGFTEDIITKMYLERELLMEGSSAEYNEYGAIKESIDLEEITNSFYELKGAFLHIGRYGQEEKIFLEENISLYPSDDLYPSDTLYPVGQNNLLTRTYYRPSTWYDENYTLPYSKVSCTFVNPETTFTEYKEHIIIDVEEGQEKNYQTYDLSENFFIKRGDFSATKIETILSELAKKIKKVQYMPADIDLVGLPYIEVGDAVRVLTTDGGFETVVLRRTLQGIQSLRDNYESRG